MPAAALWTKDFVKGTLANFFLLLNLFILLVVMSAYAMEKIGSSPSEAGLAVGIFVIGALFSRLFSGQLIERMGRRRMLFSGITLGLAMTILYFVTNNIWYLCIVRFLHGLGYGTASVAIVTVVTNNLPKARKGEGIGYFMMGTIIATAIGPFLAMFFMQHGGFTLIFLIGILALLLSLVSAFTLSFPKIQITGERLNKVAGIRWSSFFEFTAIPISIVCALLYFAYSSVISFLTPYTQEIYLADSASYFFVVFSIAILVSRPLTGRLFDSKGENYLLYPAFPLFGFGFILLGETDNAITLLSASILLGLGFGIIQACGMATALKDTPPHRLGFASSTFYVFVDIGVGIGPFTLGLFVPYIGYRGMYLSLSVVSFICIFVYYLLHGRKAGAAKKLLENQTERF